MKKKNTIKEAEEKMKKEVLGLSEIEIKRRTKYIIHFEDDGQDFLRWYIDKDGYVLDSRPCQRSIWAGKHTIPDFVKVGDELPIWLDGESYVKYPIKKIEVKGK